MKISSVLPLSEQFSTKAIKRYQVKQAIAQKWESVFRVRGVFTWRRGEQRTAVPAWAEILKRKAARVGVSQPEWGDRGIRTMRHPVQQARASVRCEVTHIEDSASQNTRTQVRKRAPTPRSGVCNHEGWERWPGVQLQSPSGRRRTSTQASNWREVSEPRPGEERIHKWGEAERAGPEPRWGEGAPGGGGRGQWKKWKDWLHSGRLMK